MTFRCSSTPGTDPYAGWCGRAEVARSPLSRFRIPRSYRAEPEPSPQGRLHDCEELEAQPDDGRPNHRRPSQDEALPSRTHQRAPVQTNTRPPWDPKTSSELSGNNKGLHLRGSLRLVGSSFGQRVVGSHHKPYPGKIPPSTTGNHARTALNRLRVVRPPISLSSGPARGPICLATSRSLFPIE